MSDPIVDGGIDGSGDPSKFLTSLDVHPRLLAALAAAADLQDAHVASLVRLPDDLGRHRLGKRLCEGRNRGSDQ